jgi:heme exporter protein D
MNELLYMGGYAAYVWSAYGLTAAVLIGMIAHSLLWHRRLLKDLRRRSARSPIATSAKDPARREGGAP